MSNMLAIENEPCATALSLKVWLLAILARAACGESRN